MKKSEAVQLAAHLRRISLEEAAAELEAFVKERKEALVYPFDSELFMAAWNALIKEPKWRKKTYTAYQSALKKLSKYSEEVAIQAIEDASAGGYQGIFPENVKLKGVIFENEAQKRLRQNKNVSDALTNGEIQWKQ